MTIEAFTFTTEQFLGLLGAIGAAVFFITWRIRGVEKDVENLLKNPFIKAVRDIEEKHAKENVEKLFEKTLNRWEAEKKAPEGEDSSKQ